MKTIKLLTNILIISVITMKLIFIPDMKYEDIKQDEKDTEFVIPQEVNSEEKAEIQENSNEIITQENTFDSKEHTEPVINRIKDTSTVTSRSSVEREIPQVTKEEEETNEVANDINFLTPCVGKKSQGFKRSHPAVDIYNSAGTEIYAAYDGTCIKKVYSNVSYGNHIVIEHPDGYKTLYAHLQDICIDLNQEVNKGDLIGHMGRTGNATGNHLHFEIHKDGIAKNPLNYITLSTN